MPEPLQVIAWVDAGQEQFICDAAADSALRFISVGSSDTATAADLARKLSTDKLSELRQAIASRQGDVVWLIGAERIDRDLLRLIQEASMPAFTCQPQPESLGDLTALGDTAPPHFVPLMRRAPGYRAASDVLADFGDISSVNLSFRSSAAHALSLFSRLYDAMDIIDRVCGSPIAIDAANVSRTDAPPETLARLDGHLTLNMRFAENRCACAALSDDAGTWFRGVTILGPAGCLRIHDDGFEWLDPQGNVVDSHIEKRTLSPGERAAEHLVRVMNNLDPAQPPHTLEDHARLLALCEAARLSCRTGHSEAPRKVLEMLSRP